VDLSVSSQILKGIETIEKELLNQIVMDIHKTLDNMLENESFSCSILQKSPDLLAESNNKNIHFLKYILKNDNS